MATAAVDMLRELMEHDEAGAYIHKTIRPELLIRNTCAPPFAGPEGT